MSIDIFSYSDKGDRPINEDCYGISNGSRCVVILCDGLGGHECGEVASKFVTERMIDLLNALPTITPEGINNAILQANIELIKQQQENPHWSTMRTTLVGCIVENDMFYYFNSGDSRLYYMHNGILQTMTKDHSVSQMSVELGQISFANIRHDPDRSRLLKVLGDTPNSNICSVYKPVRIAPGDAFLLCSDGFWEYVLEDEMEIDLSKSETAQEWLNFMTVRLLLRKTGNNDNFTAVCGMIN